MNLLISCSVYTSSSSIIIFQTLNDERKSRGRGRAKTDTNNHKLEELNKNIVSREKE